jgi:hypothetical protein
MKRKITLIAAIAALAGAQSASAQSSNCAPAAGGRAQQVYDRHLQCAVDIAIARMFVKSAQPDTLPKFEEAMGSYFNRLLGVGEVVDLTQQQVTGAMLDRTRLQTAKLASNGSDVKTGSAQLKDHMDRAKDCFRSVGYSIN